MKQVTVENYREDKYYPRVVRAVAAILSRSDTVTPVEVLVEMGNLSRENCERWREGRVPYLERVFQGNLSEASRILRILGFHLHDLKMVVSQIHYARRGKGTRKPLQFSRSGTPRLEDAYSREYRWNRSQEKKLELVAASGMVRGRKA